MFRPQLGFSTAAWLALSGLLGPAFAADAQDAGRAPAWVGTIEVQRHAHVVVRDGAKTFVTDDSQRILYTLHGDGPETATFDASHHSQTSGPLGTSRVDGSSSGVAEVGIEYLDTYQEGSFWHLFIPSVQIPTVSQASLVPGVTRDKLNTEQAVVEIAVPRDTRVLTGRFTRPWRGDPVYEAAPKIGGTAQATETVIVSLRRVSNAGGDDEGREGPVPPPPPVSPQPGERPALPYPQVTIHGPACACRSTDGEDPQPLRYTATASWVGGTFDAFSLAPGRRAPHVLANEGGAHPRLELLVEAPIDPVTLGINYRYQGFVYAAEPLVVQWCSREPARGSDDRMALAAGLIGSALSQGGEEVGRLLRERLQQELARGDGADVPASPCME